MITKHQAYRDLAGTECPCSATKLAQAPLCAACQRLLPRHVLDSLYEAGGYADRYERVLGLLKLQSVAVRADEHKAALRNPGETISTLTIK